MKKNRLGNVWGNTAADDVVEPEPEATKATPKKAVIHLIEPKPEPTKPTPKKETKILNQSEERRGPGRPPGKRTNPDYQSVTTFLHKQTYLDVQRALVGSGQDFGDVVDDLLKDWLKQKG